jgi:hypothetical protein
VELGKGMVPIENGYRLQECDEYVVEVWRMMFNWRLVVMLPNQTALVEHGFCYFGTSLESLARAVAAGIAWEDPLHTAPNGYDKQAF